MEKYVLILPTVREGFPDAHNVFLVVNNQQFKLDLICDDKIEAEWFGNMLCIALCGLVNELFLTSALGDVNEWRPINTAPKDSTKFWGLVGNNAITMFWHPKFNEFVSSYRRMTMAPGLTFNGEITQDHSPIIHDPTHWMPIPEVPK
jgi:hypothetical protein